MEYEGGGWIQWREAESCARAKMEFEEHFRSTVHTNKTEVRIKVEDCGREFLLDELLAVRHRAGMYAPRCDLNGASHIMHDSSSGWNLPPKEFQVFAPRRLKVRR